MISTKYFLILLKFQIPQGIYIGINITEGSSKKTILILNEINICKS